MGAGQAGVPHTLIPDVAAGSLMRAGEVDVVLVGADRIAANGDTANKVGTYPLAVLAARHDIPFYVRAAQLGGPRHGGRRRDPDRGAGSRGGPRVRGVRIARSGRSRATRLRCHPGGAHHGVVTEEGLLTAPFEPAFRAAVERARERWAATPPGRDSTRAEAV